MKWPLLYESLKTLYYATGTEFTLSLQHMQRCILQAEITAKVATFTFLLFPNFKIAAEMTTENVLNNFNSFCLLT